MVVAVFFCETPAQSAPKGGGGGIAKGSRNPIISKPKLPKEIVLPWSNSRNTWDDYKIENIDLTISDCGLGGLPKIYQKKDGQGVGSIVVWRTQDLTGGGGSAPVADGARVDTGTRGGDPKKGIGAYLIKISVKNSEVSNDNSTTATALTSKLTIEVDPTDLEPGLTKQTLVIAPIKVSRARKGTSNTTDDPVIDPPQPPQPPRDPTKRVHLRNKPDLFGGSNKPSTASTRISLRAGRTGGAVGGSGGVVGGAGGAAAGGGNGGGGGQKGGAGGGNGGGGGQKGGS